MLLLLNPTPKLLPYNKVTNSLDKITNSDTLNNRKLFIYKSSVRFDSGVHFLFNALTVFSHSVSAHVDVVCCQGDRWNRIDS